MYVDINGMSYKCRVFCECYPILTTISNTPFSFNFRHMVLLVGKDNEGHVEAMLKAIMFEGLKYMTRKDDVLEGVRPFVPETWKMAMPRFWLQSHPKYLINAHYILAGNIILHYVWTHNHLSNALTKMWTNIVFSLITYSVYHTMLSNVENRGSPYGPTMVDCWVVRVSFGWSVYMMWSEMTTKQQCRYVLFIFNQYQKAT